MGLLTETLDKNGIKMQDYDVFIETGYHIGTSFNAMYEQGRFDTLKKAYSIEVGQNFVDVGLETFEYFAEDKYNLICGDSSTEIEKLLKLHSEDRIIFWLDAHFSGGNTGKSEIYGECPVMGELQHLDVLNKKPLILIDDISYFGTEAGWPHIDQVIETLKNSKFDFNISVDKSSLNYLIAS